MTARRSRGEGSLYWDDERGRWIASASLGYGPDGRRIRKKASGRTKTEAKQRLKDVLRDYDDGLAIAPADYTVERAVNDWLEYGLSGRDEMTVKTCQYICRIHVLPALGSRRLRDLSADDVDRWLAQKSLTLSTRTLQAMHSCLNRSVKRAMARDKVKRNVVELCSVPTGTAGRPSKSLTMAQAMSVLDAAESSRMYAYVVLSLLTGARTEELRALTWDHVRLDRQQTDCQVIPPHVAVWRSVRKGGDTKTQKSRRTLASARALRRGAAASAGAARGGARRGRGSVARTRPRFHEQGRNPARPVTCPPRLSGRDQEHGRCEPG